MKQQHLAWMLGAAVGLVASLPLVAQHQERPPAHEERPQSHQPSAPRANQGNDACHNGGCRIIHAKHSLTAIYGGKLADVGIRDG